MTGARILLDKSPDAARPCAMNLNLPEAGSVFHYPYLWSHEKATGVENPKDRTVCLVLRRKDEFGNDHLIILPISDHRPESPNDAVFVPDIEKRRAGLDVGRAAYVHVNDYNIDILQKSWNYDPKAKRLGRFGKAFTRKIAATLANAIKAGQSARIDRT